MRFFHDFFEASPGIKSAQKSFGLRGLRDVYDSLTQINLFFACAKYTSVVTPYLCNTFLSIDNKQLSVNDENTMIAFKN